MSPKKKIDLKRFMKENWISMIPYIMFIVMVIVMGMLNHNSFSLRYIANKSDAAFSLILVAAGQTIVLLTGGFDLSVGGVICITNCLAASHMQNNVGSMLLWAAICMAVGIGVGIFNGYIIEKTKLQPFIVTLATQYICYGVALLIMKVDGGNVPIDYISGLLHRFGPIPLSMILIVVLVLVWMFFKNSRMGFSIYAIGRNESSASGMVGTIVGALVLRNISDLLVFMKVSSYWSSLVQGVLLILAVAVSAYGTMLKKRGGTAA